MTRHIGSGAHLRQRLLAAIASGWAVAGLGASCGQDPSPPTPASASTTPTYQCARADLTVERVCIPDDMPPSHGDGPPITEWDRDPNGCAVAEQLAGPCGFGVQALSPSERAADGHCCYWMCTGRSGTICGRPLTMDRGARMATPARGPTASDWSDVALARLAASARRTADPAAEQLYRALEAAWLGDALAEHASVASFGRFTLELLAIGAPAVFVEAAHRAALDEVVHARLCFALAQGYAGDAARRGPGRLALSDLVLRAGIAEVAAATAMEACCAETIAACVARAARSQCRDAPAREALDRIAPDEAGHAELGWSFVAWAVKVGGREVAAAVGEAFAAWDRDRRAASGLGSWPPDPAPDGWAEAGRLDRAAFLRVEEEAAAVIRSCAAELLRDDPSPMPHPPPR